MKKNDTVQLKANWSGNGGDHTWAIQHISEYAGGEAGDIVAELVVENERRRKLW